ncbi:uncharacterized protein LOC143200705 [Rhynchophorus ferrugineus]|uniref:uncharacterized protein LOC143200705 n=1 Tax=Rhynchophorus ferrugineus TaxID=354439 RepID=UPI003FCCC0D8
MISSKDKLLVLPWQQRKYEHHRRKISTAVPVVDNKCPPQHSHVRVKLKKKQKEQERSRKIEHENLILLQRLNHIMSTHWLDNYLSPQPNFLNRVKLYDNEMEDIDIERLARSIDLDIETEQTEGSSRKLRCIACSPIKYEPIELIEERMPWEPIKKPMYRSRSVPPRFSRSQMPTKLKSAPARADPVINKSKTEQNVKKIVQIKKEASSKSFQNPHRISLSRGSLKLSLNFPIDTLVKLNEKLILNNVCHCCSRTVDV